MSSSITRIVKTIEDWLERAVAAIEGTDGAVNSTLATAIAGERNTDSATGSYLVVKDEWTYTSVDLSANSTTVSAVPAIIGKVWVNTVLSAHACPIKDNTTTVFSLPASAAATISDATAYAFAAGTRFETSLIVDPDDAATGTIVVQWRPI